jgi:hypothetical protein
MIGELLHARNAVELATTAVNFSMQKIKLIVDEQTGPVTDCGRSIGSSLMLPAPSLRRSRQAIANRRPLSALRHLLHPDCLTSGIIELAHVGVKTLGVRLRICGRFHPHHALDESGRRPARQDRNFAWLHRPKPGVDRVSAQQFERGTRRVV